MSQLIYQFIKKKNKENEADIYCLLQINISQIAQHIRGQ